MYLVFCAVFRWIQTNQATLVLNFKIRRIYHCEWTVSLNYIFKSRIQMITKINIRHKETLFTNYAQLKYPTIITLLHNKSWTLFILQPRLCYYCLRRVMVVIFFGAPILRFMLTLLGMTDIYILSVFWDPYVHRGLGDSKWHKLAKNMKF